jgi:hypothetical protein
MKKYVAAIALAGALFVGGAGTAFAHPSADLGIQTAADAGALAPFGSHVADQGLVQVFDLNHGNAVAAIEGHNPLCPAHISSDH